MKTPRGKFAAQKAHAKRRGVPFELTFEEWWDIWQKSGHWDERGKRSGQYCMARRGDAGGHMEIYRGTEVLVCNRKEGDAKCSGRTESHPDTIQQDKD